jgi:hypothetical protein
VEVNTSPNYHNINRGHTMFHLCLKENDTPNSWASSLHKGTQRSIFVSERNNTPISWAHPTHGHTQLMGSLIGRLTQSMSWRMSHAAVIINTPSQLGRHSPSGQVLHKVLELLLGCSHQYSLSAREVFSIRPSLSRKYSIFVLAIIINTPSQLGRYSPPSQVSHGSTRTSSWQAVW